jgi:hypothetical protein
VAPVSEELAVGGDLVPEVSKAARDVSERPVVSLPPGSAQALRDFAQVPGVRRGLGRFVGKRQRWLVELTPTASTKKALESGALKLTETKSGKTLAQARSVKTGTTVENIGIKGLGQSPKAVRAATAGAAVAWQAMAIATQQHYLVEISGRLTTIERGIADVLDRHIGDRASELEAIDDALTLVEQHIAEHHPLTDNDRQDVRAWHQKAQTICMAHAGYARRVIDAHDRDPARALPDLYVADRAAQIATRCAAALLRMPPESTEKHLAQFSHYAEVTQELIADVDGLFDRLSSELETSLALWRRYISSEPGELPKHVWNRGPGTFHPLHWGEHRPRHNGLLLLDMPEKRFIRDRAQYGRDRQAKLAVTQVVIDAGDARLLVDQAPNETPLLAAGSDDPNAPAHAGHTRSTSRL